MKGLPFPASAPTPAHAETSSVTASGESGLWGDEERQDMGGRARRELSVIEESSSIAPKDDDVLQDAGDASDEAEPRIEEEDEDQLADYQVDGAEGGVFGENTRGDSGLEAEAPAEPQDVQAAHVEDGSADGDAESQGSVRSASLRPVEQEGTKPIITITA